MGDAWELAFTKSSALPLRYIDDNFMSGELANEFVQVFIVQQLLSIAGLMDLSDEVGR